MITEVPNLDCLPYDDLLQFWSDVERTPSSPAYSRRVLTLLGHYALLKAQAIRHRLQGNIEMALANERVLDRIYARLPDGAAW